MRNFKNAILFTVLLSFVSYPSFAASDTTVYPPTNQAAGGGLLYFPAGGNSSLYAVPVLADQSLITALGQQTTALNSLSEDLTAAVKAQTAALREQTEAIKQTKDLRGLSIYCVSLPSGGHYAGGYDCVIK